MSLMPPSINWPTINWYRFGGDGDPGIQVISVKHVHINDSWNLSVKVLWSTYKGHGGLKRKVKSVHIKEIWPSTWPKRGQRITYKERGGPNCTHKGELTKR